MKSYRNKIIEMSPLPSPLSTLKRKRKRKRKGNWNLIEMSKITFNAGNIIS